MVVSNYCFVTSIYIIIKKNFTNNYKKTGQCKFDQVIAKKHNNSNTQSTAGKTLQL